MRRAAVCALAALLSLPFSAAFPFDIEPVASIPPRLAPGGSYEYAYNIRILEDGVYAVLALAYVEGLNATVLLDLEHLPAGTVKALRGRVDVPPDARPGPVFVIFYIFYRTGREYAIIDGERGLLLYALAVEWGYIPDLQAEKSLTECKTELGEVGLRYLRTLESLTKCKTELDELSARLSQVEKSLAECKSERDELSLHYLQLKSSLTLCRERLEQWQNLCLALAAAALVGSALYAAKRARSSRSPRAGTPSTSAPPPTLSSPSPQPS